MKALDTARRLYSASHTWAVVSVSSATYYIYEANIDHHNGDFKPNYFQYNTDI